MQAWPRLAQPSQGSARGQGLHGRWQSRLSILCETNATPSKLKEIQQALATAGHDPGPNDGVIRAQTMSAVNSYRRAKGLPVDVYLNLATVKALGVSTH